MNQRLLTLSLAVLMACSGCATKFSDEEKDAALTGGIVGTTTGAATGAIIGASISNGDVLASTGLGAGAGLAVGVVGGVLLQRSAKASQISRNEDRIEANREDIGRTQAELDQYREQLLNDTMAIEPDRERGEYRYEGPSLGNYYR